jgi:mono/diheme cytochrome c family protein
MPAKTPATEEAAMLKAFLFISAVVIIAIIPAPAPAFAAGRPPQDAAPASTNPVKPTTASQEKAKKLYSQDCAMCHGDNGNGKTDLASSMQLTLADWTDSKSLGSKSDQELFDVIRKGKGDKMPPEDPNRAKDADVWGLITYIRAMSKNQPAAPTPAAPAAAPAAPGK